MKRQRWTMRKIGGVLLASVLGAAGCKQQLFMEPADHHTALNTGLMAKLETSPHAPVTPSDVRSLKPPATVLDTSRPPRMMALLEAVAIGMERGNVGGPGTNPGFTSDQLPQSTGRGTSGTDAIQAFAVAPALAKAEIERSLSKFDARIISSMTWNVNDQPTLSLQQSFSNGDSATLSTTIAKPLPTGGVAGITFSTAYQKLAQPPSNPSFVTLPTSYTPRLQFVLEQPLLQSFGIEVNQLNPNHPGSLLIPGFRTTGQGTEGILLTRVRSSQQRAEFDRLVNLHLYNIEAAYWNLYAAYYNLAAQEDGAKQALEAYFYYNNRAGGGLNRESTIFQYQAQYEAFRAEVIRARDGVLSSERNLRGLLGMRSDDDTRLVPTDEPTLTQFSPSWEESYQEMLAQKPELMIARQEVKARQLDMLNQKNLRRPDVRLLTSYDIAGLGPRLDGANITDNALRSFASNQFNSWQIGIRGEIPIGFRDANALVRQAELNMKLAYIQAVDADRKAEEVLADQYRRIASTYEQIKINRQRRIALQRQLSLELNRRGQVNTENDTVAFLQAQSSLATATASEYRAIADYNISLAGLEWSKGTSQRYNNVTVGEGALPAHVQKKAADHFAARENAIKLREHPADLALPALPAWRSEMDPTAPMPLPGMPGVALPTPPGTPGMPGPMTVPPADKPMTPPVAPPMAPPAAPLSSGTGATGQGRPQLVPADAPAPTFGTGGGTFQPSGSVQLPSRIRPAPAAPTTPIGTTPSSTGGQ